MAVALVALALLVLGLDAGGYDLDFASGLALVIWWTIAVGVLLGLLPRSEVPTFGVAAAALLVGLTAVSALSIGWAADNGRAFDETARWTAVTGVFLLALLIIRPGDARRWIYGLALGLGAVAMLALASRFEPAIGNEDEIRSAVFSTQGRLSFPLGYWNALGAAMALLGVVLVWLSVHARTRLSRAVATAALPVPAVCIYLASSRGSVIAAGAGLLLLLALSPARAPMLGRTALGAAFAAVIILIAGNLDALVAQQPIRDASGEGALFLLCNLVLLGALGWIAYQVDDSFNRLELRRPSRVAIAGAVAVVVAAAIAIDPVERFESFKQPPTAPKATDPANLVKSRGLIDAGSSGRYQIWGIAFDAFEEEPLRGIGAGGFTNWFDRQTTIPFPVRDAHSLPLEVLAELGIAGIGLLAGFFALVAIGAFRKLRDAPIRDEAAVLACVVLTGLIAVSIDWTWDFTILSSCIVVSAAFLVGVSTKEPVPRSRRRVIAGTAASILLIALAGAALWIAGISYLGERKRNASQAAVAAGDLDRAALEAEQAVNLQPWAAKMRVQQALVAERRLDYAAALAAVREANARSPLDGSYWLLRARAELRSGRVGPAKRALERSRRLKPLSPLFAVGE